MLRKCLNKENGTNLGSLYFGKRLKDFSVDPSITFQIFTLPSQLDEAFNKCKKKNIK